MRSLRKIIIFSAFLAFFTFHSVFAQPQKQEMLEFPVGMLRYLQVVVSSPDQFHLLANTGQVVDNGILWNLITYNKGLEQKTARSFVVDPSYVLSKIDTLNGEAYLFYTQYTNRRNVKLYRIQENQTVLYEFQVLIPLIPEDFQVCEPGKTILVSGNINLRPLAALIDIRSNKPTVLPGLFNTPGKIISLKISNKYKSVDLLVENFRKGPDQGVWLKSYNLQGEMIKNIKVENDFDRYNLVEGDMVKVGPNDHVVVGTYGKNKSTYSRGVYYSLIGPDRIYKTDLINFADLPHFFSYTRKKRYERLQKRIARKKEKGKTPRFSYRLKVQSVNRIGEQLVINAESYYIKYRDPNSMWGFSTTGVNSRLFFDGYGYTHFMAFGLSLEGDLLWDNSIRANQITQFTLKPITQTLVSDQSSITLFPERNHIKFSAVKTNNEERKSGEFELKLTNEGDFLSRGEHEELNLVYWDEKTVLIFGKVQIRNRSNQVLPEYRESFILAEYRYD